MRTTVRIEDDVMRELKDTAARKKTSLTRILDRTLRAGLRSERRGQETGPPHHERTHSMGEPRVDLTKALSLATRLEDDELVRKAQLRK